MEQTASINNKKFAQVVQRIDPQSTLVCTWRLEGGISAQVTALEIRQSNGQLKKMIVRQHGAMDLHQNHHVAEDEFNLLKMLHSAGLATPTPYYFDQSGEIFPTPYVVVEYVEGKSVFSLFEVPAFIPQFTTHLSSIHTLDYSKYDVSFLAHIENKYSQKLRNRPANVDESLDEGHIRDVLEAVWPLPQQNVSVLLHGDYWPGNIIWRDGQLAAIIDWEDAILGDPLADLANSRLEVLWAFGIEAMEHFTQLYTAMKPIDLTNLPYWDLCAALRPAGRIAEWAGDAQREQTMREGHRQFITQALKTLSGE